MYPQGRMYRDVKMEISKEKVAKRNMRADSTRSEMREKTKGL